MSLKLGDIVELNQDYNDWAKKGHVGVVEDIEVADNGGILVYWRQPLCTRPSTVCWDWRLQKVGEVEHAS